jgi:hypothetical protein
MMIPQWRVRWVERENGRRGAAHGAYFQAWQHEDANLRAARTAAGDQGGQWDPVIAAHQQQRPLAPPTAEPHQAPATAWWTPVRVTLISIVGGLLVICLCGQFLNHVVE